MIGITGNELADKLAQVPTIELAIDASLIPHSDFCVPYRKQCKIKTENILITESIYKGNKYFFNLYKPNNGLSRNS